MKITLVYLFVFSFFFMSCVSESREEGLKNKPDTIYDGFQLVWADEFNYKGLPDSTKWSYDVDGNEWNWGNNELQHYTLLRKENAWVDGQHLHIKAIKESWADKEYTSARLITKNKGDWLYGRFEIRAKLPSGKGTWPAIWMLPTDWEYGGWPKSGEIDIMEHVGYEPDSVFATVHTGAYNHGIGTHKSEAIFAPDCEDKFHNYVLEWEENECRAYFDTILYFTFKNKHKTYKEWPFDKRFHLLLNVAVGGNWGGAEGVNDSIFPQEMVIDYVRIYQKEK